MWLRKSAYWLVVVYSSEKLILLPVGATIEPFPFALVTSTAPPPLPNPPRPPPPRPRPPSPLPPNK